MGISTAHLNGARITAINTINDKKPKNSYNIGMNDLNIRQRKFVRKITKENKPASVAYAESYGGKASDGSTRVKASKLLTNTNVVKTMVELENDMQLEAVQAYLRNKELAKDAKTPANVRNDINKHIQALGGVAPVQKIETKNETVLQGITDKQSIIDLAQLAIKKHTPKDSA